MHMAVLAGETCNLKNMNKTNVGKKYLCKVGKINFPLLLVNGCDDKNVLSTKCAEDVSIHTHAIIF